MHRKTHVVTTSVLGGLLLTIPAFAQTTTTTTQTQTQQGSRSHFNPSASTDINAQPSGAGVHANANINDQSPQARGSQATSSAGCPPGCVAARHYTPAQVAAMRRSREERRDQLAREQAERDQQLQDCRTRAERAETEAQQLRAQNAQAEQDRLAREQAEREERDRKAREAALVQPYVPTYSTTVRRARGGGPNYDMRSAHLLLGLEGGVGGWTGAANAQYFVGPTWGARAGVNIMNWLGIEARYFGMWNQARVPVTGTIGGTALNVGTVTNELTGVLRLTVPTPYIRPYGFAGVGGAWNTTSFINGATAQTQGTTLRDNRSGVVPVGGGLDVPIGGRWGLGFEGAYHWYMNQNFTTDPTTNTGGQWHTSMNVHVNI